MPFLLALFLRSPNSNRHHPGWGPSHLKPHSTNQELKTSLSPLSQVKNMQSGTHSQHGVEIIPRLFEFFFNKLFGRIIYIK